MNATQSADHPNDPADMLGTLKITKTTPRTLGDAGVWVTGTIGGLNFEALVFPNHAESEAFELDDSRISKLHLEDPRTRECVACFDRGWDQRPKRDDARTAVDLLAAGLAEHIFNT